MLYDPAIFPTSTIYTRVLQITANLPETARHSLLDYIVKFTIQVNHIKIIRYVYLTTNLETQEGLT